MKTLQEKLQEAQARVMRELAGIECDGRGSNATWSIEESDEVVL